MTKQKRRNFIRNIAAGTGLAAISIPALLNARPEKISILDRKRSIAPSDKVRLGAIGMGIMGNNNINTALQIPGVELTAVCDLYDGRLAACKENYGDQIFTTRKYKELIDRDDVDAVLVATSDHWHDKITIDALNKGKTVYCEKPMVHKIEEGKAMIEAEKSTGKVLQIGSQRVSSILISEPKRS